jgi:hypothetical protein
VAGVANALGRPIPAGPVGRVLFIALISLVVGGATDSFSQTVDPRVVEFQASLDHDVPLSDGSPTLDRYDLEFYLVDAASPFQIAPLGKPTPEAGGLIRVELTSVLTSFPSLGIVFEARVSAVGPVGSSASIPSNTFTFTTPCGYSITPTSQTIAPGGGTASVVVTTFAGCEWTAVSNDAWITVTTGDSESGGGTVTYSVPADLTGSYRTGTLTVAGTAVMVNQDACEFSVSPTSVSLTSSGGTGTIAVTAPPGCPWTATSGASWLTITNGADGTGSESVTYSATPTSRPRTTTLSIAGQTVPVSQGGATGETGPWDDLVVDFGAPYGIWMLRDLSTWELVTGLDAELITAGDVDGNGLDDLVIDFGPALGLWNWLNRTTWEQVHPYSARRMATGDVDNDGRDNVAVDFESPGSGVYVRFDEFWTPYSGHARQLTIANVDGVGGDDLVVDIADAFFDGIMLIRPGTFLLPLAHRLHASALIGADLDGDGQDDIIATFAGYGVWVYKYGTNTWTLVHPFDGSSLAAGDLDGDGKKDLIVDFGTPFGLYIYYNNSNWVPLHSSSAEALATGDLDGNGQADLVVDFGSQYGLWAYMNNTTWQLLHPFSPERFTLAGRR